MAGLEARVKLAALVCRLTTAKIGEPSYSARNAGRGNIA